jgi:hypothetical protein
MLKLSSLYASPAMETSSNRSTRTYASDWLVIRHQRALPIGLRVCRGERISM